MPLVQLTAAIYRATREAQFARDFALRDQIRAAGISTLANIAEGFERGSRPAFLAFLRIAKGSVGEVRSHLYVALDVGYISPETFLELSDLAKEAGRLIGGLMRTIRNQPERTRSTRQLTRNP